LWAEQNNAVCTILRPTIIYDGKHDKNITRMARFIKRWRFLPVAAPAKGLRQPIHFDDVAKAALLCLNNPDADNKAFNISGGEILTYRAMAERVFTALGMKPRFLMLPTALLQKAFRFSARIGLVKETSFGASMFQRMNEDLIFDTAEGLRALNYQPRRFEPAFPSVSPSISSAEISLTEPCSRKKKRLQ
jgi:nucleoside-diphosphate-sugar epimerase